VVYALGYFCFRQSHIENWEFDKQDYVMFPAGQMWLYHTFRPAMHVDERWTGMHFQIGPHPEERSIPYCPVMTRQPRCTYKKIEEVVSNKMGCFWIDPLYVDSINLFSGVYFNHEEPRQVFFNYSDDCIIKFSYKVENNKINVLWKDVSVCNLNITGKKEDEDRPFISFQLENDSTLKTTVINKELVKKLNTFDRRRRLIAERFCVLNIEM
jgi:hypothetical protein